MKLYILKPRWGNCFFAVGNSKKEVMEMFVDFYNSHSGNDPMMTIDGSEFEIEEFNPEEFERPTVIGTTALIP